MMSAQTTVVGLFADNGAAWLEADQYCREQRLICIPLPAFFTPKQVQWAVQSSGMSTVLTDQPALPLWSTLGFEPAGLQCGLVRLQRETVAIAMPTHTAKITFTSGSTGQPKGVCLARDAMDAVAGSIANIMQAMGLKKHLSALPFAVLLENVAGADAARLAGVECITPSLVDIGWQGSSQWDAQAFLQCVQTQEINSAILLPQMLKALLPVVGDYNISSLQLLAVGGARVASDLLLQARNAGLPVYEGYGLSECASVVAFNRVGADKPGTVGKPLPHVQVRLNSASELEVCGAHFLGYLGDAVHERADVSSGSNVDTTWLATGDLAHIDDEGFVSIIGRKKNLLISSFGRNISPEWVESELLAQAGILQAAVFGEAKPVLSAVIFAPALDEAALQAAIAVANSALPDYAQIQHVIRADESFSASFCLQLNSCLATSNGRNKRDAIAVFYSQALTQCYTQ